MRRTTLAASAIFLILPFAAMASPEEDAFRTVEKFKTAFDAADVQGVVSLFAPDALFLGTLSPILATKSEQIDEYFQGIKFATPRSITIESSSAVVLSENAVLFTGLDKFTSTKEGKTVDLPARFTMLITKGDQGWRIKHFHSSARPAP